MMILYASIIVIILLAVWIFVYNTGESFYPRLHPRYAQRDAPQRLVYTGPPTIVTPPTSASCITKPGNCDTNLNRLQCERQLTPDQCTQFKCCNWVPYYQ